MKGILVLFCSLLILFYSHAQEYCPKTASGGTNLISNGDFSAGNDGSFTSGFSFSCCSVNPGQWGIATNPQTLNGFFQNIGDHTTGTGNMMVVDANTSTVDAYCTTVNVLPNTLYFFSAWVANINNTFENPSRLVFKINGAQIGDTLVTPDNNNNWVQFFTSWNSGGLSGAVSICLENANSVSNGNDFALDDLVFSTSCEFIQDIGTLGPESALPDTMSLCNNGSPILLDPAINPSNITFQWKDAPDAVTVQSSASTYSVSSSGLYYVCWDTLSLGCPRKDSVFILSTLNLNLGPDVTLCDPPDVTLNTNITQPGFDYTWEKDGSELVGDTLSSLYVNQPGVYTVIVDGPGPCDGTDDITISTNSASTPNNGAFCAPPNKTVNLSVTGTGGYKWYDAPTGGTHLNTGANYTTPPIGATTTYYVEDTTAYSLTTGYSLGDPSLTNCSGGWAHNNEFKIDFDVTSQITLDSITVRYDGPGGPCCCSNPSWTMTINLRQGGSVIQTATPTVPCGNGLTEKVPVGFTIPAGSGYRLEYGGTGFNSYKCSDGAVYPINVPGIMSMTGNATGDLDDYGGLWDWVVSTGTLCDRIPVVAQMNCSLPVEFLYFNGKLKGNAVALNWGTASEEKSSYFVVQRSVNGVAFENIGIVNAAGYSNSIEDYAFSDYNYTTGVVYYRLKEVDIDGQYQFSDVISIQIGVEEEIFAHPNPFAQATTIIVRGFGDEYQLQIADITGKVVFASSVSTPTFTLGENFAPGVYIVKVVNGSKEAVYKLIKSQ